MTKTKVKYLIIGIILSLSVQASAALITKAAVINDNTKIKVYGQAEDIKFVNVDGYNYAKVRDLAGAMGGVIMWDAKTETIIVNSPNFNEEPAVDLTEWIRRRELSDYALENLTSTSKLQESPLITVSFTKKNIQHTFSYSIPNDVDENEWSNQLIQTDLGQLNIKIYKNGMTYFNKADITNMMQ